MVGNGGWKTGEVGDEAAGSVGVQTNLTLIGAQSPSGNLEEGVAESTLHQPATFNFTSMGIYVLYDQGGDPH